MIHTAKQLKDKVKNLSGGKSDVAQTKSIYRQMMQLLQVQSNINIS